MNLEKWKKRIALSLTVCLLGGSLWGAGAPSGFALTDDRTGNLLPNGGFEETQRSVDWTGGIGPAGATVWKAAGNPLFSVDDAVYRSGSRSARIDGSPPNASRGAVVQQIDTMEVGKPYLISGWIKTENVSNTAYVRLQYKRNGGQSVNVELANRIGGTTDWTYFSRVVALPDTTDNPSAPVTKVEAFLEQSTGTVWFDDFSVREHVPVEDFALSPDYLEMNAGDTALIEPVFTPENAANRNVRWSSSDSVSVSVYPDGRVRANTAGYAIIAAESLETGEVRRAVATVDPPASLTVRSYFGSVAENGELSGSLTAADSANGPLDFAMAIEPRHGTVTVRPDGTFLYYPDRSYAGTDEFTFMVRTDRGGPKFAKASIEVTPSDEEPALDLLWHSTTKGEMLTGKLGNVLSPDADTIVWSASGPEPAGEWSVQADGSFTYTPAPGFIGYDTLRVTATAPNGKSTEGKLKMFVVPDAGDFLADLRGTENGGSHPRLLATTDEFASMRGLIENDPYMAEWFERLKRDTDAKLSTGDDAIDTNLLVQASLMHRLTGDMRYAQRAIRHLDYMAGLPDWGGRTNNMLTLSYSAYTTGLAYDWLYDAMTEEQRTRTREAIRNHVFSHALDWYDGVFRHNGEYNNINFVDNGSFAIAALALLDEEGEAGVEAVQVLQGAYRKLQHALRFQTEDGALPEGPSYWQYGTMPLFLMMAALHTALGTDYGLTELEGMSEAGDYPLHLRGPNGTFNFSDGDIIEPHPQSLWLADYYGKPEYAWYMGELYRKQGVFSPLYMLFYKPGMFEAIPSKPDRTFSGIEAIAMRSGWEDPGGLYAAMRGFNETLVSHNDLDAGTFVFDAFGERWALDLGNENYNLPGFWQYQEGTRWTYYRKGTQGHNTIVVNPLANPVHMQDFDAPALLVRSESKPLGAFGILDLTERYPREAMSIQRGLMLTEGRQQLIVQDEIKLKAPSEIYWFMHTKASIDVIEDGRAALLAQNDKKLYVKMLEAPAGAVFSVMNAEPLPGTPNPEGQTINHDVRKLTIRLTDAQETNLSLWMVPLHEEDPLPEQAPVYAPLSEWSIPDGELPPKPPAPTADSVTVDGHPLSGFHPLRTYYEVAVPFERTSVPRVEAESRHELAISEAEGVPGRTRIYVTNPDRPGVQTRYTIAFVRGPIVGDPPDVNRLPVAEVTASSSPQANLGYTPDKTLDRDLSTRWTSEGRQWIQYDLGEPREVGAVSVAFTNGDARKAYFSVMTSLDGKAWTMAVPDAVSSGLTSEPEVYHFAPVRARYVRIFGSGNSASRWNNYAEVGIFRPVPVAVRLEAPAVWKPGERNRLKATYRFADGRQAEAGDVVFASGNQAGLSIDAKGYALAKKPGTVEIAVTDRIYGLSAVQTVEVRTPGSSK